MIASPLPPTRESEVLRPSLMIAISDGPIAPTTLDTIYGWADFSRYEGFQDYGVEIGEVIGPAPEMGVWSPTGRQLVLAAIRKRHFGKWNVVFCDGHVQGHRTKELFNYNDDAVLSLRNKDHLPHRELFVLNPP